LKSYEKIKLTAYERKTIRYADATHPGSVVLRNSGRYEILVTEKLENLDNNSGLLLRPGDYATFQSWGIDLFAKLNKERATGSIEVNRFSHGNTDYLAPRKKVLAKYRKEQPAYRARSAREDKAPRLMELEP